MVICESKILERIWGFVRVKSEFKGSKVPNSLENFEEKYQVIIKKVIITEEFRRPKVSF
jgi:hypothetical protein